MQKKISNFDEGIYLKCLLAYDDVKMSPVKFRKGFAVVPSKVLTSIERHTEEYLSSIK